jgi:tetratricopeptide (TPR) repeat protein
MKKTVLILMLISLWGAHDLRGQATTKYDAPYVLYYHAEELFEKAQFSAARKEFNNFILSGVQKNDPFISKAYYYEGLAALELFNEDAIPLLEAYNLRFPENINRNFISFKIGNYFFQKEDFENAVVWFEQVSIDEIDPLKKEELLFKHGYSALQQGDRLTALHAFRDVKDGASQYAAPSLYFFSHLSYLNGSLQVSLDGFEKLKVDPNYSGVVPYYIIQIYHKQNRFQDVVNYAPTILDSTSLTDVSDVYHLLGDAHYKLKQYKDAAKYLEIYYQKSQTTRVDDYQIAYSLFRINEYEKAIKYFDRVARIDDSLGQTAMYQIADSYQKLGKLLPARSAFYRASEMKSVEKIQEDALYNFAILSFKVDINPYDESVKALENYLRKYPKSNRKDDIYQCLVNVYSNTSNYLKALESLELLPSKDTKLKAVYQVIAYNYGVELFLKNKYREAISNFDLVSKYNIDSRILALSKYWRADAYYHLGKYTESIAEYKLFLGSPASNSLDEKTDAYYNLGYAYWNKEQFNDALDALQIYIQANPKDKVKKLDALLKLADGYYTNKQNALAIQYYKETIKLKSALSDRATYYLAKSYGYNGQLQLKLSTLLELLNDYENSKYRMSGIYELAKSYKSASEYDPALLYFRKHIADYPQSGLLVDCQLEIADIHYKKWNYAQAELDFKQLLLENDDVRDVCADAVKGLMAVYVAQKHPEKAADLADQYPCADVTSDEKENLFYNPAIQSYVDSNYVNSIPLFETYLAKFPDGRYAKETHYFLGNSYFKTKDTVQAVKNYEVYLSAGNSTYSEFAALRVSNFYYAKQDYVNGIKHYKKLDLIATKVANIFAAKLGLMSCYFLNNNFQEAIDYAKIVLEDKNITNLDRVDAEYVNGVGCYKLEKYTEAIASFNWLTKNTNTSITAESRYYLADIYVKSNNQTLAEKEINAILKMKPRHDFWIGKALLLKTNIDISNNDYFQAEQSLRSVLDFYPKDLNDGILIEANEMWEELMQLKNPIKIIEEEVDKKIEIN